MGSDSFHELCVGIGLGKRVLRVPALYIVISHPSDAVMVAIDRQAFIRR